MDKCETFIKQQKNNCYFSASVMVDNIGLKGSILQIYEISVDAYSYIPCNPWIPWKNGIRFLHWYHPSLSAFCEQELQVL